jgi:hypothetical protein
MGDPTVQVYIENATDAPVVYGSVTIEPGKSFPDAWPSSFDKPANVAPHRITATDTSRLPIFCHVYTTDELKRTQYKIKIVRGQIDC